MKTYESDDNDDLSGGDIGTQKGYGPCISPNCPHSREELQDQLREAQRELENLRSQLSRASSWNVTDIVITRTKIISPSSL